MTSLKLSGKMRSIPLKKEERELYAAVQAALQNLHGGKGFLFEMRIEDLYPDDHPDYPGEVNDLDFIDSGDVKWDELLIGEHTTLWSCWCKRPVKRAFRGMDGVQYDVGDLILEKSGEAKVLIAGGKVISCKNY